MNNAPLLDVPSDAPIEKYRTLNLTPVFNTTSANVTVGGGGNVVNNPTDVQFGGQGQPVSNED